MEDALERQVGLVEVSFSGIQVQLERTEQVPDILKFVQTKSRLFLVQLGRAQTAIGSFYDTNNRGTRDVVSSSWIKRDDIKTCRALASIIDMKLEEARSLRGFNKIVHEKPLDLSRT